MRRVNQLLAVFCLFCVISKPAFADEATRHRINHNSPDCAAGQQAAASTNLHDRHHATKACKDKKIFKLTVTLEGAGSGRVSSDPAGIYCQIDCSEDYVKNTRVVLSAQPYTGSVFTGWSGDCSGTAQCSIKLKSNARTVMAHRISSRGNCRWATVRSLAKS